MSLQSPAPSHCLLRLGLVGPAQDDQRNAAEDGNRSERQPQRDRLVEQQRAARRRDHRHAQLHRRRDQAQLSIRFLAFVGSPYTVDGAS